MKLPPDVWGPFFWHTIHIAALGYPSKPTYAHKKAAKEFYESLAIMIPCPVCREHFSQHIALFPISPHLDSREDLFNWTVVFHNAVNKTLGKPEFSQVDSLAYYKRIGARGTTPVLNHTHLEEIDYRSFAHGLGAGLALTAAAAGILYLVNK
jgi:hypothetical protein